MLANRAGGKIKAVWLCRYDPVSTALFGDAAQSLETCELVVVQHLFMTDSAKYAHVVLPTTAFGEEQVTFTSAERRIQLAKRVIDPPPPGPMPAWEQLTRLGRAMGADWNYDSSAAVMEEIGETVPTYGGASHENLLREYGRQWPCTKDRPLGTPMLFSEEDDKAAFKFAVLAEGGELPQAAQPNRDYPMTLVFGHSLYYWNQSLLIKHSETLKREYRVLLLDYPNGFVEINTEDAKRLDIRDGHAIRIVAASGSGESTARVTPEVRSGTIFVPYFVPQLQKELFLRAGHSNSMIQVRVEKGAA